MKPAFLYGGQGSQVPGMGHDFYEKEPLAKEFYDAISLEKDVKELSFFSGKEVLQQTNNTQVVLVAFQIMVTKLLKEKGIIPKATAGLSIGEYGALYAADVLNEKDALRIAEFRGNAMEECSRNIETEMYAILGTSEEEVSEELIHWNSGEKFAEISNLNCPGQVVISGEKAVVLGVVDTLKSKGKKALPLKVSGPFHTKYMAPAQVQLQGFFEEIEFQNEKTPVYYNVLGKKRSGEPIKELMTNQVSEAVRWQESIENMLQDGIDEFIEIGFNRVIRGFIKKIDRKAKIYSIATHDDFIHLLEEIR